MKKSIILVILLSSLYAFPDSALKLSKGAKLYIGDSTKLTITGSIIAESNTSEIINDGEIELSSGNSSNRSDFINDASPDLLSGEGTFVFSSDIEQAIGGEFPTNFHNLRIDNYSAMGLLLGADIYVGDSIENTGNLIFTNGMISTNSVADYGVHISNNSIDAIKGYDQYSHIATRLTRRIKDKGDTLEYIFPVGSYQKARYVPVYFQFTPGQSPGVTSVGLSPKQFSIDDTLGLTNVMENNLYYNKLFDLLYYDVQYQGSLTSKYNLYMDIQEFDELRSKKYGIVAKVEDSDWGVYGDLDAENSRYRDFYSSNFTRRTNIDQKISSFALASFDDLQSLTEVNKVFTNSDKNSGLMIENLEFITTNVILRLFNRTGDLVYELENYQKVNGTAEGFTGFPNEGFYDNNEPLPNGTYFYLIETQGETFKTGYIHLQFYKD